MSTVNLGELVTTTLRNRKGDFADAVTNNNALLKKMRERGNLEVIDGGRTIVEELIHGGNGTFNRYSGWQTIDTSDGNVVDAAEFAPVQASVVYSINGREQRMNRGKSDVIRLVEARMEGAMSEMVNNISNDMYSDGTTTNQIGGLQLLIADDPTTSSSVGGINQGTHSFWRNQVYDFSDAGKTAAANMTEGMNKLWLNCTRGADQPDLIVMDEEYFTIFENSLQVNQRYAESKDAELGFQTLKYKGASVIHDTTDSGIPANHAYFINTKYMKLKTYEGANFEPQVDGRVPVNQDGIVYPILFMGNLTTNNRARHGVLKG